MERVEHTIEVNVPVKTAYEQCVRFTDYPRFMEGVEAVRMVDERHVHWRAVRQGRVVEWSSVITERDPERSIAWHDLDGPHRATQLSFAPLPAGKVCIGMAVTLPQMQGEGADESEIVPQQLAKRMAGDLERLKKLLESGGHDWNEWSSVHDANAASARSIPVGDVPSHSDVQQAAAVSSESHARSAQDKFTDKDGHEEAQAWTARDNASQTPLQSLLHGWEQPFSIVRKMSGEMDQLFERLIGRPMSGKWGHGVPGRWVPTVEVAQRANEFVISADLPGVSKQDVHVEIQDDKLTIEGERREPGEQKSLPGYRRSERHYGRFYRQIPLPAGIPPEKVRATLINGVLEIRMPLPPGMGRQGRRVDIEDLS